LKTLYPAQEAHLARIVAALTTHGAAMDMSQTGCGKTLVAVRACKSLGNPATLVICPKAVIPTWVRELAEQGVVANVINYEMLRGGKTPYLRKTGKKFEWLLPAGSMIVFDEMQKCKSPASQNCKLAVAAKPYTVLMLSATLADDPTELRAAGYLLGMFELPKYWGWLRSNGCKPNPWGAMEFDRRKVGVLSKIHEFIIPDRGSRMTVADMAGHFADNFIVNDPLDFGDAGAIQKLYAEMDSELSDLKQEMADDSTNPAAAALVAQLRARQAVELCKVPLIADMATDALAEGRSVAIFVNFQATIDALIPRLPAGAEAIYGGQNARDRQDVIDRFQSDESRTVVCNMEAGGVGVNLHDTRGIRPRTALISPNFNAKTLVQVLGRIHRAGGKSPCIQRILIAAGTVEEKVMHAVKEKIKSQELLNGAQSSLSTLSTGVISRDTQDDTPMPETTKAQPDHASRAHAEHSPSALRYFEICPGYKPSGGTNWAADKGTRVHEALESEDISLLKDADEQAIAARCLDYLEQIKATCYGIKEILNETRYEIPLLDCEETFGTCDVTILCDDDTAVLVDYKTGFGGIDDAEINCQAWAYSLGAFMKWPNIKSVSFYFLMPMRDEFSHATFPREMMGEMILRITTIIQRAKAGLILNPQVGVCDYCGNKASCKALANKALLIARQFTSGGLDLPDSFDDFSNLESVALKLKLAPILEDWAKQIKATALDLALNEGVEFPGFQLSERKTPRSITSALLAYEVVKDTVALNDFLAACSKVSVPDLEKNFAESLPRGKKGTAKQELVDRLTDAGCLKQDGMIHVLKQTKK